MLRALPTSQESIFALQDFVLENSQVPKCPRQGGRNMRMQFWTNWILPNSLVKKIRACRDWHLLNLKLFSSGRTSRHIVKTLKLLLPRSSIVILFRPSSLNSALPGDLSLHGTALFRANLGVATGAKGCLNPLKTADVYQLVWYRTIERFTISMCECFICWKLYTQNRVFLNL